MKASEYQAILKKAARRDAAVPGLAFPQCVELAALGAVFPEVRESRKWQLEWEYCLNRWKTPQGWDGRFLSGVRREAQWLSQCANGPEGVTDYWREFAWKRYRVRLKGTEVEKLKSSGRNLSTSQPFNLSTGASREISRFEGGAAPGTGKYTPEGRGANCNGFATALRGDSAPSEKGKVKSEKRAEP